MVPSTALLSHHTVRKIKPSSVIAVRVLPFDPIEALLWSFPTFLKAFEALLWSPPLFKDAPLEFSFLLSRRSIGAFPTFHKAFEALLWSPPLLHIYQSLHWSFPTFYKAFEALLWSPPLFKALLWSFISFFHGAPLEFFPLFVWRSRCSFRALPILELFPVFHGALPPFLSSFFLGASSMVASPALLSYHTCRPLAYI
jgi:hypothetical protein